MVCFLIWPEGKIDFFVILQNGNNSTVFKDVMVMVSYCKNSNTRRHTEDDYPIWYLIISVVRKNHEAILAISLHKSEKTLISNLCGSKGKSGHIQVYKEKSE